MHRGRPSWWPVMAALTGVDLPLEAFSEAAGVADHERDFIHQQVP
jgi:hypothetical protein